jgi:hypothetical protein
MTDQSFSVQLTSLLGLAHEMQTQIEGIAAPMNAATAQSGVQPQFGAFAEASALAESQQAAIEEMYALLGQVKQALGFAENVTTTVAAGYQQADQDVAANLMFRVADGSSASAGVGSYGGVFQGG